MTWTSGELTVERRTYGRNVITYTGAGSGVVTLERTTIYADGRISTEAVAGAAGVPGGQPDVWVDGDVPFGSSVAEVVYELGASSVTVPAESRRFSVLSDPVTGLSCNVVGTELGDRSWRSATNAQWLEVTVHGDPSIHSRPEQAPTQNLTVMTGTRYARDTVAELCAQRRPLLLRSPEAGVADMWFVLVGDRSESRPGAVQYELRAHQWDLHTITRPDPATTRHTLHALGDLSSGTITTYLGDGGWYMWPAPTHLGDGEYSTGSPVIYKGEGEYLLTDAGTAPRTLGDLAARWSTLGEMASADVVTEVPGL